VKISVRHIKSVRDIAQISIIVMSWLDLKDLLPLLWGPGICRSVLGTRTVVELSCITVPVGWIIIKRADKWFEVLVVFFQILSERGEGNSKGVIETKRVVWGI
jgi:hypothetical protein